MNQAKELEGDKSTVSFVLYSSERKHSDPRSKAQNPPSRPFLLGERAGGLGLPVVTAALDWAGLDIGVDVVLIR